MRRFSRNMRSVNAHSLATAICLHVLPRVFGLIPSPKLPHMGRLIHEEVHEADEHDEDGEEEEDDDEECVFEGEGTV